MRLYMRPYKWTYKANKTSSQPTMASFVPLAMLLLVLNLASADLASDRAECTQQLVGMATCLPYVQGDAKSPTPDCCTGLKSAIGKSPKCLCVLVRDRDDPSLGLKINLTLALALPSVCSTPANISKCPELLKLPPGSPEAEVFKQPKAAEANATSGGVNGDATGAHESSGGRSHYMGRKTWLEVEMIGGILLLLLMPLMVING